MASLNIIEKNLKSSNKNLVKAWFRASTIALALTIGLSVGAWGLLRLAVGQIGSVHSEISSLEKQKKELQTTVDVLERQTWGVRLIENQEGRFIVLSPKVTAQSGWTYEKNTALELE